MAGVGNASSRSNTHFLLLLFLGMDSSRIALLHSRLLSLGVAIGALVEQFPRTRMGDHIAGQLIRSGTSPAANYAEACAAESMRDFIYKLGICLKELRETSIWLEFVVRMDVVTAERAESIRNEVQQLTKIIARSILTAKKNASGKSRRG